MQLSRLCRSEWLRSSLRGGREPKRTLREEESGHPVGVRVLRFKPLFDHFHSFYQVLEPRAEGFQRGIGDLLPDWRQLVI